MSVGVGALSYLREPDSRSDMRLALTEVETDTQSTPRSKKINKMKMKPLPTSEYSDDVCSGCEPFISVALTTRLTDSQSIHAIERLMKSHRRWRDVKNEKTPSAEAQ